MNLSAQIALIRSYFSKRLALVYIIFLNLLFALIFVVIKINHAKIIHSPIGYTIQVLNSMVSTKPYKTVYGYLPYWTLSNYEYLQYDKLTDIAYFGLIVDENGNFKTRDSEGNVESGYKAWKQDERLQEVIINSKIWKIRFALTIIMQNDDEIQSFLDCRECWNTLLDNTIAELSEKGLKDVNLDFEQVGPSDEDLALKYADFAGFMNSELDKKFGDSKVVVAAFADSYKKPRITQPELLAKAVDGIFIMAYDFHYVESDNSGPVAPLEGAPDRYDYDVQTSVKDYKKAISSSKLILGVPYYGYNFLTENLTPGSKRVPGSDAAGFSIPQYYAVIKDSKDIPQTKIKFDEVAKSPYITYVSPITGSNRVLYFENAESLKLKYEFAKAQELQGVGIWALGYDGDYPELWKVLGDEFKQ